MKIVFTTLEQNSESSSIIMQDIWIVYLTNLTISIIEKSSLLNSYFLCRYIKYKILLILIKTWNIEISNVH